MKKTTRLGAVLVVAGVLAAACSSSSKPSSTPSNTAGSNTAGSSGSTTPASTGGSAPKGTPIKLGVIAGYTGPLASSVFASKPALQAWAAYTNAHGGINGHPVQLIIEDDLSNPGTSFSEIHTLVGQDHIVALFEESNYDTEWGSYVAQNKVPMIPPDSTTVAALTDSNVFTPGETIDALPASVVQAAQKVGAKKMAVLYCAESPDCTELTSPIKKAATAAGINVSYAGSISVTSPNYTAPCLAAEQSGATAVFVGDAVQQLLAVAKDCNTQGYKPVFIGDDGAVAPSFSTASGWSDGMIAAEPNVPFNVKNTPATEAMYAAFNQYEPGFTKNPNFNELAVEGWAAGMLFEAAAKAGNLGVNGPPTSAEVYNGLYSPALQGSTLDGISPPLHFTKGKVTPNDCWFWQRTAKGNFTEPYGLTPTCSTPASAS